VAGAVRVTPAESKTAVVVSETADAPASSEISVRDKGRSSISLTGGASGFSGALSAAAGVDLYQSAQALEQLSRTPESRAKNKDEIAAINAKLSDSRFVEGFGSIGGEEFFSYLNINDSLKRTGGKEWVTSGREN
jgi:hypothetical protein